MMKSSFSLEFEAFNEAFKRMMQTIAKGNSMNLGVLLEQIEEVANEHNLLLMRGVEARLREIGEPVTEASVADAVCRVKADLPKFFAEKNQPKTFRGRPRH